MNILKILAGALFLLVLGQYAKAQCAGFHKSASCYAHESKEFKTYTQSKGAVVEIGKTFTYQAFLFGGKDYIFNLCSEQGKLKLHFRIINVKTEELIYDNVQDDYNLSIGFAVEKDITVKVEATILTDEKDKRVDPMNNRTCLGIRIMWRMIPKIGF
jgi:hypothetical protein